MELASLEKIIVRAADGDDVTALQHLLHQAYFTHYHADWYLPIDWVGDPGFVVSQATTDTSALLACLAATTDVLPAAWVRLAAILPSRQGVTYLEAMLAAVVPYLRSQGVTQLGWLAIEAWPDNWLPGLGFHKLDEIVTYVKEDLIIPEQRAVEALSIRPVKVADIPFLAKIESEALGPLWRHTVDSLQRGWQRSCCFDVAFVGERLVGFQYSVQNQATATAHLVRITVHPDWQSRGVGHALLAAACRHYQQLGLRQVTLNTQLSNIASHRLYEKFGFYPEREQLPIWVQEL